MDTITRRLPVEGISAGDRLADRWDCSDGPTVTVAEVRANDDGVELRFVEDPVPGHWHHLRRLAGIVEVERPRQQLAEHYAREARLSEAQREIEQMIFDLAELPCACPPAGACCLPCRARHILEVTR